MPRGNNSSCCIIYNVPKILVKSVGSDRVFNFSYQKSSDGYAHVILDKSQVIDSSNPKFYNISLENYKQYDLIYKNGDSKSVEKIYGSSLRQSFNTTRKKEASKRKNKTVEIDQTAQRELPFDDFESLPDDDLAFL